MNNPLGISPSNGNQGTTPTGNRFQLSLSDLVALSRQSNGSSNPEVVGSIPTEVERFFLYLVWFPDSLY